MTAALPFDRLAKIIPRLGSNHDGERLATLCAIDRVLKAAGASWVDLAASIAAPAIRPPTAPRNASRPPCWASSSADERDFLLWRLKSLAAGDFFSPWEGVFIGSVSEQVRVGRSLSAKQMAIVDRMIVKAFVGGKL
jgi:hypothetical protein